MNNVILIGNLCKDVELHGQYGVGSTSIAVRRDRKNDKGEYETDFFELRLFGNQAQFASNYLHKGNKVCVSGRIQIREFTTKDNTKGKSVEVLVNTIENLDPRSSTIEEPTTPSLNDVEDTTEDLPF